MPWSACANARTCSRRAAASCGERSLVRLVARDPPVAQSTKRSEPRPRGRSADAHAARSTRRLACCGPNRSLSATPSAAARRGSRPASTRSARSAISLGAAALGSNASPRPARLMSSAPANWSVENGQTSSGTPAQRASVTVLFPPWLITRSHERSTSGCGSTRRRANRAGSLRGRSGSHARGDDQSNGQRAKRRDDAPENVRARGEEAAERDEDARPRILRLEEHGERATQFSPPPNRGADEPSRAWEQRAPLPGELHRVVEEREQRRRGGERSRHRLGTGIQLTERVVERAREAVGDRGAEAAQLRQLPRVGAELLRTVGGEAVELARPGNRGRMAGMERDLGLLERAQRQRCAERELIRHDQRRTHVGDDLAEALRHRCGLPQSPAGALPPAGGASRPFRGGSRRGRR